MRPLARGLALTVAVTILLRLGFGPAAVVPGLAMGGLATLVQALAGWAHRRWPPPPRALVGQGWMIGSGLRLLGVGLFALGAGLRPDLFAPLPAALAFTGVLFPLLLMETRTTR